MQCRRGEPGDAQAMCDVLEQAFNLTNNPQKRQHTRHRVETDYTNFQLLFDDDDVLVSLAHVRPDSLQIGRATIIKGDVGWVATAPHAQGRGLGTRLMQEVVRYMRENGFHVSRLGGLQHFYARFGYVPFIRRFVEIPVVPGTLERSGLAHGLGPEMRYALDLRELSRVRPYDPSSDHAAVHRLRLLWHRGRVGYPAVSSDPGPPPTHGPAPDGLQFVYQKSGEVVGFLQGSLGLVNSSDTAPVYQVNDLYYDPDVPQAAPALIKTLLVRALDLGPTVISCRLPYDERLLEALTEGNVGFELKETRHTADCTMMQVVNLPALVHTLTPELSARLAEAGFTPWSGTLRLAVETREAVLHISAEGVTAAAANTSADLSVEVGQGTFLKWLFGICGFIESPVPGVSGLTPLQRLTLSTLFPRLPCASGPWG